MNNVSTHTKVGGFSIIELMVSIGIVALVIGIVLARHNSFNGAVLLRSEAYDVALQTREIQLEAVSALGVGVNYRQVSGVHFTTGAPTYFQSFRDANNNRYFDVSDSNVIQHNLDSRFVVSGIQLVGGTAVSQLSIVFSRPNFDALFYTAANVPASAGITAAQITLRRVGSTGSGPGDIRIIEITKTGQITVQ